MTLPTTPSRVVDLRSDTVTQPTDAMRECMARAPVGDDVFGEDPSVNALEAEVASRFGREAALFVPSGTMANQISLLVHCRPGDHVITPRGAHIFHYEGGGGAAIAGVHFTQEGSAGRHDLDALEGLVHPADHHYPPTRLVTVENTHNREGGRVLPLDYLRALRAQTRALGLKVHMDGARLFNALVATGDDPVAVAACADSFCFCLSKGLGAPVGSLLVGDRDFIHRAHRYRKMLGGGMRQAGVLAAAGRYALEHHVARLADDHRRARVLAEGLAALPGVALDPATVESNIVLFELTDLEASAFVARVAERGVRGYAFGPQHVRWVTHLHLSDEDIAWAIEQARAALSRD